MTGILRGAVLEAPPAARARREPRVFEDPASPLADLTIAVEASRAREAVLQLARAVAARLVGDAASTDDRALHALFDEALAALGAAAGLLARLGPTDATRLAARLDALGATVVVEPDRATGSITLESAQGQVTLTIEDAVRRLTADIEPG